MARDIQSSVRQVLDNDSARAIIATGVGEAIRRVGVARQSSPQRDSRARLAAVGGLVVGAGTGAVATVAAKRMGRLVRRSSGLLAAVPRDAARGARNAVEGRRDAVGSFASKLASDVAGRRSTSAARSPSTRASRKPTSRAKVSRSADGSPNRSANAKTSRPSSASPSGSASAKRGGSSDGSAGPRASAKRGRSSNGISGRSPSASRPRKPAASRRS